MYIELVKRVMEDAIELHVRTSGRSRDAVLKEINAHIDSTSSQHWTNEPEIEYDDPLCRLGYLYIHAAANATLFERVLAESDELSAILKQTAQNTLNVCALGGGPGTELLGLSKYFLRRPHRLPPRKITFTVIDKVSEWADTWSQLADAAEEQFRASMSQKGIERPNIAHMFLPLDVLDPLSYKNFTVHLSKADIIVFNYLFSENKTNLTQAQQAIEQLAKIASEDCVFVVIDRLERNRKFTKDVASLFESALGAKVEYQTLGGILDGDEQTSEMGEMLTKTLKRNPRVKFFSYQSGDDTVFWFTVKRR